MSLRAAILSLAIASLLSGPTHTSAEANPSAEAFGAFEKICLTPGGNPAASIAAAERAGWTALPADAVAKMASGADNPGTFQARGVRTTTGFMIMNVDQGVRKVGGGPVSEAHCLITFAPGDYAEVVKLAGRWAAVPAAETIASPQGTAFIFVDDRGRHSPLSTAEVDAMTPAFLGKHRVLMLAVHHLSRGLSLQLDTFAR